MKIIQQDGQENRDFIRQKVIEHNMASLADQPKTPKEEVGFVAYSDEGEIIGGITGTAYWGICTSISCGWPRKRGDSGLPSN